MSAVDEVRERSDIVAIVGDYVALKKAGRTFKALCPFHDERTPSFVVFPDRGTWRCFGACADGGDVFSFVMRAEKLDFRGALELLARRAGVVLEPPTPAQAERAERSDRLRSLVAAAESFFHRRLAEAPDAEAARAYLHGRGFDGSAAARFGLGWAPAQWSALVDALRAAGAADEDLVAAGLARVRDGGGLYDYFRGRVVFPIRDARGRAIGFGARTLDPEGVPKYLNSPQSDVFDKSRVLFGIERAAAAARAEGTVVVVEGYTDVLQAHLAGFENVVASLGTALTEHQLGQLKRHAGVIVLALDADAAGRAATLRGLDVAREALLADGELQPVPMASGLVRYVHRLEVELRVATLPAGKDPDDVVREDPAAWPAIVSAAKPLMDYLFEVHTADLDLADPSGKLLAADRLMPLVAELPDPVARAAWVGRLADLTRIDEHVLAGRLVRPAAPPRRETTTPPTARPTTDAAGWPAAWLLGQLLLAPKCLVDLNAALAAVGQAPVGADDVPTPLDRDILVALRHAARGAPPPDAPPEHRLDALPPALGERAAALRLAAEREPPLPDASRVLDMRAALLRLRIEARRRALGELRLVLPHASAEERGSLELQVQRLSTELRELQQLLAPSQIREVGKVDKALRRR
jgi:DNA primase